MANLKYNLVNLGEASNLTVFHDGEMYVADDTHPNWAAIIKGVTVDGDPEVVRLFDVAQAVAIKFQRLGDRATVASGRLYFDGDEMDNSLSKEVLRFLNEGVDDWKPLVKFLDKVMQNPQEHSRNQLYTWMVRRDFTITDEGDIVGYKGVYNHPGGGYESTSSGTASVNGEVHNGRIPQKVGDVVEMPRSAVAFNPSVGCSTGLHVANFNYANGYGNVVISVTVNPRDVVSVPTESNFDKVRVCRYVVTGVSEGELPDVVVQDVTKAVVMPQRIPAGQPGAGQFAGKHRTPVGSPQVRIPAGQPGAGRFITYTTPQTPLTPPDDDDVYVCWCGDPDCEFVPDDDDE